MMMEDGGGPLTETGFINSQPCIAEFLTEHGRVVVGGGGGGGGALALRPSITGPSSAPYAACPAPGNKAAASGWPCDIPDFAWMKEKKPSTRKNAPVQQHDNNVGPPLGE
ncbi:hypothetical protein NP493_63g04020 [Ridgeia piscesae]|uniref:Uncharacterized protein n=1 Tax=Ridgeia piscesae TaxID=27915 RepID=A0AAD9UIP7_RIDPI|nr:hypothetical protein NP493_63g04020 [Ridgeia piscesae]